MKALEKDRTRRYESASALAADVQRYLADEPIQARPPTLADQAAKWARRHRPLGLVRDRRGCDCRRLGRGRIWNSYRRAVQLERDVGEHLAAAGAVLRRGDYAGAIASGRRPGTPGDRRLRRRATGGGADRAGRSHCCQARGDRAVRAVPEVTSPRPFRDVRGGPHGPGPGPGALPDGARSVPRDPNRAWKSQTRFGT